MLQQSNIVLIFDYLDAWMQIYIKVSRTDTVLLRIKPKLVISSALLVLFIVFLLICILTFTIQEECILFLYQATIYYE